MKEKLCVLTLILLIIYSISFTTTVEGSDVQEVAKGFENSRDFKKSLGSSIDSETDSYPFYRLVPLSVIQIYQRFISPIKATSCPMYPSCSHYAEEAFKRYNPLKAFVMTADRLHRCTHDLDNYKKVEVSGFVKFFDPVEPSLNTTPLTMPTSLSVKESTTITLASSILDTSADTHSEDGRLFHFAQMLES
ncbi:MAG: membrane protein insertion efficiency factor YidD, partial [Nitrospirota bacterium]